MTQVEETSRDAHQGIKQSTVGQTLAMTTRFIINKLQQKCSGLAERKRGEKKKKKAFDKSQQIIVSSRLQVDNKAT